jgi:hypothetical protein
MIALRELCACFISDIARRTPSSSAVVPLVRNAPTCPRMSSERLVMGTVTRASVLNLTKKNSSSGLALLRRVFTASRALGSLDCMLSLASKTMPIDTGTSSASK